MDKIPKIVSTAAVLFTAVSTGLASMVVTDNMDDLSAWSGSANWTTSGGIAETAGASEILTLSQGVPAPVAEGDFVSVRVLQQVEVGPTGLTVENQYATRIAITGDASGGSGIAKSMWTRRQVGTSGGIWGHAVTAPGATPGWNFTGWNNISTIGLSSATSDVSDWFTGELVITKTASAYDVVVNYYDSTDALISTGGLAGTNLGDLANQETWYLNMGSEYQFTGAADLTKMAVDSVTLMSSIPEPTTVALLGLGLVGLLARRRRR